MLHWTVHLKGGPARSSAAAVAVEHKVYSFGGKCSSGVYGNMDQMDVHIFNTVSLRWTRLSPAATTGGGVPPMRRWDHTATLVGRSAVYVWGGINWGDELSNVLYTFEVDVCGWLKPRISGTLPDGRFGHSACASGDVMYVFGGFNMQARCTNDVYKLDAAAMVWSLINARGTPALDLYHHTANIMGKDMFVIGGFSVNYNNFNVVYDNVRVFDTETDLWLSAPSTQLPDRRWGHSAFAHNGELYIFGGDNSDRTFADLWRFTPETSSWRAIKAKGEGPCSFMSRMWYRMCCCTVRDRVVLFGGGNTSDELYILDLNPSLKTLCKLSVIQYGLDQSGLPRDSRWELETMTTTIRN